MRVGIVWGDHPWSSPPSRTGKLLSTGAVARNVTAALSRFAEAVPLPADRSVDDVVPSLDALIVDVYGKTERVLRARADTAAVCPALLFVHGTMPKNADGHLEDWRPLMRPGDTLVFSSHADVEIWHRLARDSHLPEVVIPLSVDAETFHPAQAVDGPAACRTKWGLPPSGPLVLFVGRWNIQKNLHGLLRLFARVVASVPHATLAVVGEEDDIKLGEFGVSNDGYVARLQRLATSLGVSDRVFFVGPAFGEPLADLYRATDVLVNLSFYNRENFGLAQAEALACGTPVVCSGWGGFKDVVDHGATGFVCDAVLTDNGIRVDWATGARHVVSLLSRPNLHAAMAGRAAATAADRFAIERLARSLQVAIDDARRSSGQAASFGGAPFVETELARRYRAHQEAHGWYDPATDPRPMFRGDDYDLYRAALGPYASHAADSLDPEATEGDWVPYSPSGWQRDRATRRAFDPDWVWPHHHDFDDAGWAVVEAIDGHRSVAELGGLLGASAARVRAQVANLHRLGFVLFERSDSPMSAEA